jgi:hypothetical protein
VAIRLRQRPRAQLKDGAKGRSLSCSNESQTVGLKSYYLGRLLFSRVQSGGAGSEFARGVVWAGLGGSIARTGG